MTLRNSRFFCAALLLIAGSLNGLGQASAIDQVRSLLKSAGSVTVKVSGLWATTTPGTEKPSEIRVTDGKISRGTVRMLHGNTNVPIQPGETLPVVDVISANDTKNDLLKVSVQAANLTIPIVFVFPKGSLQSMNSSQIVAQIEEVLEPHAVQAAASRSTPASASPMVPTAPPPSPLPSFVKWSEPLTLQTSDLKAACESAKSVDQAVCYSVLASLQDAETMAEDAQTKLFAGCIPEGTTAQQIKVAFIAETKAMPDQLLGPIGIFYSRTLDDKFPCPKAPPKVKRAPAKK